MILCIYAILPYMRTTLDLPDGLFRRMKAVAALRGQTLKDFLLQAVQKEIHRGDGRDPARDEVPVVRSRKPGSLRLTNAEIEDILAGH